LPEGFDKMALIKKTADNGGSGKGFSFQQQLPSKMDPFIDDIGMGG